VNQKLPHLPKSCIQGVSVVKPQGRSSKQKQKGKAKGKKKQNATAYL
jgi:hypothetical protein